MCNFLVLFTEKRCIIYSHLLNTVIFDLDKKMQTLFLISKAIIVTGIKSTGIKFILSLHNFFA